MESIGGVVRQRFGSTQYQEITDIAIDAEGRIVAGATLDSKFWCGRFLADGDLDETFGDVSGQARTGWTTVDFGFGTETLRALDVTADGEVVLGGKWGNYPIVARLLADGTLDTSFHEDGKLTVSAGVLVEINDLLVEPDGRIVLGGLSVPGPGINFCLMIGRLNADGTTDTSFAVSGWRQVDTDATEWADERVLALARQADGKIIAAGYTQAGELTLARLSGLTRHYAMQDANWNLTGIVDPATGQAVERYVFTPYGGRTVLDSAFESRSTSSFGWIVGHQGLAADVETGLVYNQARYLDTSMGRFTIRDPLGYVDGMSLYEYVRSIPTVLLDPSGRNIWDWIGKLPVFGTIYDGYVPVAGTSPGDYIDSMGGWQAQCVRCKKKDEASAIAECQSLVDHKSWEYIFAAAGIPIAKDMMGVFASGAITTIVVRRGGSGAVGGAVSGGVLFLDSVLDAGFVMRNINAIKEGAAQAKKINCKCPKKR